MSTLQIDLNNLVESQETRLIAKKDLTRADFDAFVADLKAARVDRYVEILPKRIRSLYGGIRGEAMKTKTLKKTCVCALSVYWLRRRAALFSATEWEDRTA